MVDSAGPAVILHLLPRREWEEFVASGEAAHHPASLASEGFVHCTGSDELMLRVANGFYRALDGEVAVLVIDPSRLRSEVIWEAPVHADPLASERFPHIYGPIDRDAVVRVRAMERDAGGGYTGITP